MKTVQMSPPDLTAALLGTDPQRRNQAFKTLYMSPVINGKIRDWAKMYNLRDKTSDDVLQEGVILLDELIRTGRFRGDSRVETFLLGICKNLIRDSVKKVNRVVLKDSFNDAALSSEDDVADHLELSELTQAEQRRDNALQEAMRQLTDKCREALSLYYFEQKTMAQVAEARNLANAEQAKKAVFRCRESLRGLVSEHPALGAAFNR
jgi:RNA polymerase sigma factor (sigma-70 family)